MPMDMPEDPRPWLIIECPCCGDDAWVGQEGDPIYDGEPLRCGCRGHISCDRESEPSVFVDDCLCQFVPDDDA